MIRSELMDRNKLLRERIANIEMTSAVHPPGYEISRGGLVVKLDDFLTAMEVFCAKMNGE